MTKSLQKLMASPKLQSAAHVLHQTSRQAQAPLMLHLATYEGQRCALEREHATLKEQHESENRSVRDRRDGNMCEKKLLEEMIKRNRKSLAFAAERRALKRFNTEVSRGQGRRQAKKIEQRPVKTRNLNTNQNSGGLHISHVV